MLQPSVTSSECRIVVDSGYNKVKKESDAETFGQITEIQRVLDKASALR